MKIELVIERIKDLKRELYYKRIVLKNYCIKKNISYTSTSRILSNDYMNMNLRTAYNILGLTPERNLPQGVMSLKLKDLLIIKKSFTDNLI